MLMDFITKWVTPCGSFPKDLRLKLNLKQLRFLKLQGPNVTSNFQIIIDDETMYSIVNNQPQTYLNVQATIGNSYENPKNQNWLRKYSTANAKYRNLIFKSGKNKKT